MTNPLDTGAPFRLEMMNPNVQARSTKEGMVYRLTVEVTKETFDAFSRAELKGMILEGTMAVVERHGPGEPKDEKPKRHWNEMAPAQQAALRCKEPAFQQWLAVDSEEAARDEICATFGIESRRELNDKPEEWKKFDTAYSAWLFGTGEYLDET